MTVWYYLDSIQLNILEGFNPPPHDRGQGLEVDSKRAVVIVTLNQHGIDGNIDTKKEYRILRMLTWSEEVSLLASTAFWTSAIVEILGQLCNAKLLLEGRKFRKL